MTPTARDIRRLFASGVNLPSSAGAGPAQVKHGVSQTKVLPGNIMLKMHYLSTIIFILSMFVVVSCGGAATPSPPEVVTVVRTVEVEKVVTTEVPTPAPVCGNFGVTKIIGAWKTDNGPAQSEFAFRQDCTVVVNIERTGEEAGQYTLLGENKLLLSLPDREGQLEIKFEGNGILILEDVAADVKLTLQKSSE